jgi:hypothetical protein
MADAADIGELKRGILTKNPGVKNRSFRALLALAHEHPETLYPDWDFFASLISPERGADTKYIGLYILAELTAADSQGSFAAMFNDFYALLDDASVIPASHAALVSGRIARHLPELAPAITERLLSIEDTHHQPGRRDLIKSYVIQALDEYYEDLDPVLRERILQFVVGQLKSLSPKTARLARQFMKNHINV